MSYDYDSNYRLSQVKAVNGIRFYVYTENGLLSEVTDRDGSKTRIEFNEINQPISVEYPDGTRLYYAYNSCKQRSYISSNTGYNSTYLYDGLCRISKVMNGTGSIIASYEYGNDSKLIRKRLGNGIYTEYSYVNNSLRLLQLKNFHPNNTLLSSYLYICNELGYRIQATTLAGTWTYKYDVAGQLIEWTSPQSSAADSIVYDQNRNRVSRTSSGSKAQYYTNSMYQYTQYGSSQNFNYDKNGNLLQKNISSGSSTTQQQFTYNADGRVSRTVVDRSVYEYKYTVFG